MEARGRRAGRAGLGTGNGGFDSQHMLVPECGAGQLGEPTAACAPSAGCGNDKDLPRGCCNGRGPTVVGVFVLTHTSSLCLTCKNACSGPSAVLALADTGMINTPLINQSRCWPLSVTPASQTLDRPKGQGLAAGTTGSCAGGEGARSPRSHPSLSEGRVGSGWIPDSH